MLFKRAHATVFIRHRFTNFFRSLGFIILAISSAMYFISYIQPTVIFFQHEKMSIDNLLEKQLSRFNITMEETPQSLLYKIKIQKENVSRYWDETFKNTSLLLESEKKGHQQTNTTLNEKIELCKKELKQERDKNFQLTKMFKEEKENLESYAALYRQAFDSMMTDALRNKPYPGVGNYTRFAAARLGMLPLTNVKGLKPEFGAVINDVLSFRYRINIPRCQDVATNRSVFIAVISAPDNFNKRSMIRKTWRTHLKPEDPEGLMGLAGFAFIMGLTENNVTQSKIEEESRIFGDIIQIEMSDFYRNLTLKVAGLLNWLYRYCTSVGFVLKVDDDVYINVRNLAHLVQTYHPSNQSIFGSPGSFAPNRSGKWEISFEEWPWGQYPPYFLGPAILMPQSTILPLLAAYQTTPFMPFDDLYLTGICTEKAGIKIKFSSKTFSIFKMFTPNFCDLRRVVAWLSSDQNYSHLVIEDFYHNTTHKCIETDSNGVNRTIDHNELVNISL